MQWAIGVLRIARPYEPDMAGDGLSVAGDAVGSLSGGVGETAGVAVSAGVLRGAVMGVVAGIAGAELNGWIGMGVVLGASCTGVALGTGVSITGVSGARSQAETKAARNSTRTFFIMLPS